LTLGRWRGFFREPSAVFWTFGFPLLLSLTLGVAFRNRPPEPVYAAIEQVPGSEAARAALAASADVNVIVLAPSEARNALRTGRVALVVVPGATYSYRYDPTRPESRLARLVVNDVLQRANGRVDPIAAADLRITEPGSRYIDFLIPGLVGMGLMSSGLWGVGFALVEMRTRKLIKRLVATPMRKSDFLLGFVFMRVLFLCVELPLILGFAWFVFSVGVRGSIPLLAAIALLGSMVFAAIGLLIASRAQNTQTVGGLMNLFTLPMFVFSGVFFSAARFPASMQPFIKALPLTALNDALRAVMIDGAGLAAVTQPIAVMVAWLVVSLGVALKLFVWR
jgi:ABC-type multidrug transport system permease subunit